MSLFKSIKFIAAFILLLIPAVLPAQSSYDPSTSQSFSQATAGMTTVTSFSFGTTAGNNITNLQQLAANFNPYGIAGQTVINQEWERYQAFNSTNFSFQPSSLSLTATIPSNGGLFGGGINSAQVWSKQTFQPGITGQNVYAISVRMKFPSATGMWPAIWLAPLKNSDQSEIDIVEFETMQNQNQYDWTGFNHGPHVGSVIYSKLSNPWVWHPGFDFSSDFHNYQMIWTPDATFKYFDDQLIYAQYFNWSAPSAGQLGVNLAVGSYASYLPGLTPNSLSEFPATLQLQSITVLGGSSSNGTPAPPSSSSTATYNGSDSASQGTWTGKYGGDGYQIANGASNPPSYANVSITGNSLYTWAAQTTDPRALQTAASSTSRIASTYYSSSPFNINVNLNDGASHRVVLYLLDWDSYSRADTITIRDASTNTILDTQSFSGFHNGLYASWNITGNVIIQVAPSVSGTACVSGIFFGPPSQAASSGPPAPTTSASFSGLDTTTQGSWTGKYGKDGYSISNGVSSFPSYANLSVIGSSNFTWAYQTTDTRALQTYSGSSTRLASTYYSPGGFSFNVNMTDGNTHRIALYLLDWDASGRSDVITISDASTNVVYDTRTISNFSSGVYALWNIKGSVVIQVKPAGAGDALVSAIFFN